MDVEEEVDHKSSAPPSLYSSTTSLATRDGLSMRVKPVGVWVVPSNHLGADSADGDLDLRNANVNNADFDKIPEAKRPDVILIKRLHTTSDSPKPTKRKRRTTTSETASNAPTASELGDIEEGSSGEDEDMADDVEYYDAESGVLSLYTLRIMLCSKFAVVF
ncbi:unnamed protein product [Dibothriocephalus latus]|uniref:Uncharacterized protein n=1 Tax=Dibothriocephalus latus TaxID=60516 RepID=A0A3P7Q195_DIBLA|nr:unnamed protein product [Dibothriocephalus latus]